MSGILREALDAIALEIERFRNRPFLEAVMAASALVATADGAVKLAELATLDEVLETVRALRVYDPHQAVDLYRQYAAELLDQPQPAREKALRAIARIADEPDAARILLKIALAIGMADDALGDAERAALASICDALRLPQSALDP
jgi:tellurite resistance protein